jgi:FkbM family methyltransferase
MILRAIFGDQEAGFYVDVGAHDPTIYSNTAHWYQRGWRGINIDADSEAIARLEVARPEDINLAIGIGSEHGEFEYIRYRNASAVNTFDQRLARRREKESYQFKPDAIERVEVRTLASILTEHLAPDQTIDFLNVDVEGWDFNVLKSNDWDLFRPRVVLVECYGVPFEEIPGEPAVELLSGLGFKIAATSLNTVILLDGIDPGADSQLGRRSAGDR